MSLFDRLTGNKTRKEDLSEEKARLVDEKFGLISFFKLSFHKAGNLCKLNLLILLMIISMVLLEKMVVGFLGIQIRKQ